MEKASGAVYSELLLKNVRCFQETVLPLDPHVTVIIGGNGSGKTTLVEALASLTWSGSGETEGLEEFPIRKGARAGAIELRRAGVGRAVASWSGRTRKRLAESEYLFAYGRYRRVYLEGQDEETEFRSEEMWLEQLQRMAGSRRTVTLSRADSGLLRDLSGYLLALHAARRGDARYESLWAAINRWVGQMDASLERVEIQEREGRPTPVVVRNGLALRLEHLSDGYQAMLVVIFDLALRFGQLFFDLERPLEGRALVAIDEVDLHLHPRWQRLVTGQLAEMFPNTQWVLTTHSPLVVQGALDHGHRVVTLQEDGKTHATEITSLGEARRRAMKGMEVGSVLHERALFGVPSRYSRRYDELAQEVKRLTKAVRGEGAAKAEYRQLRKGVAELEMLEVREDERRGKASVTAEIAKMRAGLVQSLLAELEKERGRR